MRPFLLLTVVTLLPACATLAPAGARSACVAASETTNQSLQRFLDQPNRRVTLYMYGVTAHDGAVRATTVRGRTTDEQRLCRALNRASSEVVLYKVDNALVAVPFGSPHDPVQPPFIVGHASEINILASSLSGRRPSPPRVSHGADRGADVPGLLSPASSDYFPPSN